MITRGLRNMLTSLKSSYYMSVRMLNRWSSQHLLKVTHESLTNRIEFEQEVKHLKRKYFDSDIKLLKCFE